MLSNIGKSSTIILGVSALLLFSGCSSKQQGHYGYIGTSYTSSYTPNGSSQSYSSNSSSSKSTQVKSSNKTTPAASTSSFAYEKDHSVKTKIRNSAAMHRATMRPYTVLGKKYYPTVAHINDMFEGVASWYGPDFHAKKTSNGEIYNMYAMTAAHKTLPMNTVLKVENLENGKSAVVRVNDRGPFVKQRIIDLSNAAAHKIDMVKKGTAKVRLTVLGFNGKIATTFEEKQQTASVGNYYLQVGVFSRVEGANITKRKFDMILDDKYKVVLKDSTLNDKKVKRVWISGFRSEAEAADFKESNNLSGAMIIAQ